MDANSGAWACTVLHGHALHMPVNGPARQRMDMILQRMGAHAAVNRSGLQSLDAGMVRKVSRNLGNL